MIDSKAGIRIAHLLGRRKATAPTAPPPTKTTKPTPRAKAEPEESHVRFSAAELRECHESATRQAREADRAVADRIAAGITPETFAHLLPKPLSDDRAAAFAVYAERVVADLEGRAPREDLHRGPPQPAPVPLSNAAFRALFDKVQQQLATN